ncbi:MAG: BREX-1 system adenine-specific DNA-methyltransferase PglX, partial [Caldisericia bacterium]|nr:BREX-1 system adenine-specific DNA-methyltransferase PglX [Caldisericia bacterium]
QYYQTEDHDAIYAAFKNNYKALASDIPSATQLYTPEWIVRYMVDNSLGRLWLQNKPESLIKKKLQYYIEPEESEEEIINITSPEEITFCDPACGSGHILTYAFEVLFSIYEEEGYTVSEIPKYILTNNLWGMDIDKRACQLASFALVMKARAKDKRFFTREVTKSIQSNTQPIVDCPHICNLQSISFTQHELEETLKDWQEEFNKTTLISDLLSLTQLSAVGSLLKPKSSLDEIESLHGYFVSLTNNNNRISLELQVLLPKLFEAVSALIYISKKYCIVCTNPPYLNSGKVNDDLKKYLAKEYKEGKSDLCTCFIIRNFDYLLPKGYNAMVTMQSWMFLSSFEDLRKKIVEEKTILCLVQMTNGVMRIAFGTSAFVLKNNCNQKYKGNYSFVELKDIRKPSLKDKQHFEHPYTFPVPNERLATASSSDFHKIPGSPIAYWVSDRIRQIFTECEPLESVVKACIGMRTGDNSRFLRLWYEVSYFKSGFGMSNHEEALESGRKWFPYNKGGSFRKWCGNHEYVVNWENDGYLIKKETLKNYPALSWDNLGWKISNEKYYFKESVTWSFVSSSKFGVRYSPPGFIFDVGGSSLFTNTNIINQILTFLCSGLAFSFLTTINPTLNYQVGNITNLPFIDFADDKKDKNHYISAKLISIAKADWDAYERSWNFERLHLLLPEFKKVTIEESYSSLRNHWHAMTCEMHELEEKNNKLFNEAYELEDEISSSVPLKEITLTCNPAYRYPDTRSSQRGIEEKEELLHQDTMKELLSYYVGCLFGRYSLDKPGLVLANQGDTLAEYMAQVELPTFIPDENNVVPILDDYWFNDDIVSRFHSFIKTCFGEEKLDTNVQYIERVLGKTIRQYFLKDFYKEHITTYKKRPIYWLFSSPKGSFQVLIYMHRYTKDTPSIVLRYLRDYISK